MPMRRFRKRRRTVRRRGPYFKQPFPELQRVQLKFAQHLPVATVDPGNGTQALRTIATHFQPISMNDPGDPLVELDSNAGYNVQPVGFDQYAAMYESYFVGDSLLTMHFRRSMLGTNDFVGWCGFYITSAGDDDITSKFTDINKLATENATHDAGIALQTWFTTPGVVSRRIDITHERDQGIKMQFHYTRNKVFGGHRARLNAAFTNVSGSFGETACGVWNGSSFTKPTEECHVYPWIMLQYRNGETYSETYSVHCDVSINYHTTFSTLRDSILKDTTTYNEPTA